MASGFKAKRGHIPPSPDPCARAYGIAMGELISPSLLNHAGPIEELINKPAFPIGGLVLCFISSLLNN